MNPISDRLSRFIEDYNIDGDVRMRGINHDIWLPWASGIRQDFEHAVVSGAFTPENWGVCYNGGLDPEDQHHVDYDVRLFWKAVFPGRPFPVGDPALPDTVTFPDADTRFWHPEPETGVDSR